MEELAVDVVVVPGVPQDAALRLAQEMADRVSATPVTDLRLVGLVSRPEIPSDLEVLHYVGMGTMPEVEG